MGALWVEMRTDLPWCVNGPEECVGVGRAQGGPSPFP